MADLKQLLLVWLFPATLALSAQPPAWWNAMLAESRSLAAKNAAAVPQPGLDFGKSDFTVMAWVTTTQGGTILAKAPARGPWVSQGKTLFVRDGHVVFDIGWVGNITSQRPVADGKRHHIALVSRGGSQQLFVDGVADTAGRLRAEPDRAGWVVKVGRTTDNFGGNFQGTLEDVRLYASALQDAEVKSRRSEPLPATGAWSLGGLDTTGGSLARVWEKLRRDFTDDASRREMTWERDDRIWEGDCSLGALARRYANVSGRTAVEVKDMDGLLAARADYLASRREREAQERTLAAEIPKLGFDKLVFVKRHTFGSNHYYTEFINSPWMPGGNLCVLDLKTGAVRDIVPQLQGGVFERFDVSFDAQRIVFAWKASAQVGYRLYEVGVDGSGLRQLTFPQPDEEELVKNYRVAPHYHHGTDDMQPCYLPDGGIAFISTRCQFGILCDGSDDLSTTVLYRMDPVAAVCDRRPSGAKRKQPAVTEPRSSAPHQPTHSSVSEASPVMMPDGRLLYTRWEYVDKGAVSVKCLWAMRPDGTASAEIYGNDIALPPTLIYGRPIPGAANKFVVCGAPHYPQNGVGPVIRLDMDKNIRTREPMTYMTPDVDIQNEGGFAFRRSDGSWEHDVSGRGRLFKDPYPLSERFFLVAHKPAGAEWKDPKGYGLYLLDENGRVAPLHRDPEISCWLPYPLKPRPVPPVLETPLDPQLAARHEAVCVVADVYQGLENAPRGSIKHIRVLEQIPRPWAARRRWNGDGYDQQHACVTKDAHLGLKVQHGIVPVEEDGSARFVVPAEANIFLQVLDANHMAVQTERTYVNYMPGEVRGCVGCHAVPGHAASTDRPAIKAMKRPPSVPGPQPGETSGRRALDYVADVQPVWDAHCVKCHGGDKREGNLDLSGKPTELFNVSYEQLVPERRKKERLDRALLGPVIGENHPKTGNVEYLPARSLGSHSSVLVAMLAPHAVRLADPAQAARARKLAELHRDVKLRPEELLKVTNWVDTNAQFYGTYWGRKNLAHKDHPDFRPRPTFEMATRMTLPPADK